MSQWHLIIDVERCENCNNCVLANKDEFVGNDFPGYSASQPLHGAGTLRIERKVRGEGHHVDAAYLPKMCNHCADAPCVKAGRGAVTQRPDGIVLFDPVKAKGRRDLVDACPYDAVVWNEELQLPQIWIFDAHLLDQGWKEPRCVQSCPTDAMQVVRIESAEMADRAKREQLEVLQPELGTKPRLYYKNLQRFKRCFVAGTVLSLRHGVRDVVIGAEVRLMQNGNLLQVTQTNAFGDFKFDGLANDAGTLSVSVDHALGKAYVNTDVLVGSVVLPNIELTDF